eukprot:1172017-Amphidinium_carterae.1
MNQGRVSTIARAYQLSAKSHVSKPPSEVFVFNFPQKEEGSKKMASKVASGSLKSSHAFSELTLFGSSGQAGAN